MMKRTILLILASAASLGLSTAWADGPLYIICNSATQIASGDVKEIFTGGKTFAGETRLQPVDNSNAQELFLSELGMSISRYNTIWTKKSFREGLNPPPVKAGDIEVMEFVRKTPGAVGYVMTQPKDVTIVRKY